MSKLCHRQWANSNQSNIYNIYIKIKDIWKEISFAKEMQLRHNALGDVEKAMGKIWKKKQLG